ncbi:MAG: IclR family transcriptional regulator [Porticoccaceae bacterium]
MEAEQEKKRDKGSSIIRVLEIIEAIGQAERPLSPADIAVQLGIPKPSVHRLLQQLHTEGFIQIDMRGAWMAGKRLHSMSFSVLSSGPDKAVRQAILSKLADTIGETCGIAVPDGTNMLYLDRVQTNWPLQINLPIGTRTPIWCTFQWQIVFKYSQGGYARKSWGTCRLPNMPGIPAPT